jgi:hypothetical protein
MGLVPVKKKSTKKTAKPAKRPRKSVPRDFSEKKLLAALKTYGPRMRAENFALGLPITFMRDGKILRQWADGREELIEDTGIKRPPAPKGWIKIGKT